jgi:signal transduction histidine kinase
VGFESSVRRADQTDIIVESRASFIVLEGRRAAMLSTLRDVTAQRRAEAERELFIASASHDLLQPLALIKGRAQLMLRWVRDSNVSADQLQTGFQTIVKAVEDVTEQLASLVDGARRRAGQPLLVYRTPVDLAVLVGELVSQHQATSDNVNLQFEAPAQPLVGRFDETRLRRVVTNLLSNAIKYSPGGGQISVRLTTESGAEGLVAVLEVQDRGVGIPAADLPHIFETYRRGTNVADRVPGSGLGLSAALEIVEQHGGSLDVESVEGRGSVFRLRLPISSAAT